jgi:hypothetical protein
MQFIEARQVSREEACGMYDVPPPAVHILDHATFSNITEQMRSVYRDTMAPRLALFESGIDAQLRPDFDPQGNLYAEFLLDEVLRGAFEQTRSQGLSHDDRREAHLGEPALHRGHGPDLPERGREAYVGTAVRNAPAAPHSSRSDSRPSSTPARSPATTRADFSASTVPHLPLRSSMAQVVVDPSVEVCPVRNGRQDVSPWPVPRM